VCAAGREEEESQRERESLWFGRSVCVCVCVCVKGKGELVGSGIEVYGVAVTFCANVTTSTYTPLFQLIPV